MKILERPKTQHSRISGPLKPKGDILTFRIGNPLYSEARMPNSHFCIGNPLYSEARRQILTFWKVRMIFFFIWTPPRGGGGVPAGTEASLGLYLNLVKIHAGITFVGVDSFRKC